MAAKAKSFSKYVFWVIIGLLIVGLAGFGATNMSGTVRTIGKVGDEAITIDAYGRELQREIRSYEAQTGQALPMAQARALGIDQMVLNRLVQLAALDHEAGQLGLSIGDANLQKEITGIPAFRGIDGKFDRAAYKFQLEQVNLKESDFEEDLRAESARTLIQAAITSGVKMPEVMTATIADFVGARRSFTWATLDESALKEPVAEPTAEQVRAYYEEHGEDFMLPETKKLTYVLLTPEMILDQIEIEDSAVRDLFDQRSSEYNEPERRLVERLVFANEEAASEAMAQLEVNGTTFEALVQERGLALGDVDLGDVTQAELGAAGEAVFAAADGGVAGPLPSSLGPALFRINGRLAARSTSFEEVRAELHDELAAGRARRDIESRAEPIEDLLAGGATLEEVAQETEMKIAALDWTPETSEGPAAYAAFNEAAKSVTTSDFPEIGFLEDGGIFALRLDETLPRRPEPFDSAREKAAQAWSRSQMRQALAAQAEEAVASLRNGTDFTDTGLPVQVENGLTRSAYIDGTPQDFMRQVFEMEKGELRVIPAETGALVVRLDEILPPADSADMARMRQAVGDQMDQALAQALFTAYARDTQLRARARIDQRALAAVQASFN